MVSTLQAARPGAGARDRGASAPSLFRHGSVEHGVGRTGRRERSRDQPIRAGPPTPRGSQNGMDLEARFEAIDDRLDTVERYIRLHAQTIAITDEVVTDTRGQLKNVSDDIYNYKIWLQESVSAVEKDLNDKIGENQNTSANIVTMLTTHADHIERQLAEIKAKPPVHFDLTSPCPPGAAPTMIPTSWNQQAPAAPQHGDPNPVRDPWWRPPAAPSAPAAAPQADGHDASDIGASRPARAFDANGSPIAQSPFHDGADPFAAPARPSNAPGESAYAGNKHCIFEPSRKENKMLFTFTQDAKDYKLWRNRIVDHMCRSTHQWRKVLDYVQKGKTPITEAWLRTDHVNGINAWDLAVMFESFVIDWLPKSMYTRRAQIAGGEFGNGFELWRRLYNEYQGGSDAVEFGGIRRLQEFPKCENIAKLSEHIDDWLDVLADYGTELSSCPKLLRNMLLGILPKSIEQEILDKSHRPEFKTYEGIIKFCRQRVIQSRTRELSEFARKPSAHIKGLIADSEAPEPPSPQQMLTQILAALQTNNGIAPPPPEALVAAVRPAPKRKVQAGSRQDITKKFFFKGCWHCAADDHSRGSCEKFLKELQKANPGVTERKLMKLPANYKGAYEIAREKAGLKPRNKRVAALEDEDFDSDSDFENENQLPAHLCGLGMERSSHTIYLGGNPDPTPLVASTMSAPPTPPSFHHPNKFAPLDSEDAINDMADELNNNFAHVVRRQKSKTSKPTIVPKKIDVLDSVTVRSENDLDKLLKKHPYLAAIPKNQKIRKLLRSMPVELICGPDETLCLMDSGSTINAAWIEKHFPGYAKMVQPTAASAAGDYATTAGGQKLYNKGRCVVKATVDGQPLDVAFKDMETELPILSIRKMCRKGNDVRFREFGGTIKNHSTGKILKFYVHHGVYFIKLKICDPHLLDDAIAPPPPHAEKRKPKPSPFGGLGM